MIRGPVCTSKPSMFPNHLNHAAILKQWPTSFTSHAAKESQTRKQETVYDNGSTGPQN